MANQKFRQYLRRRVNSLAAKPLPINLQIYIKILSHTADLYAQLVHLNHAIAVRANHENRPRAQKPSTPKTKSRRENLFDCTLFIGSLARSFDKSKNGYLSAIKAIRKAVTDTSNTVRSDPADTLGTVRDDTVRLANVLEEYGAGSRTNDTVRHLQKKYSYDPYFVTTLGFLLKIINTGVNKNYHFYDLTKNSSNLAMRYAEQHADDKTYKDNARTVRAKLHAYHNSTHLYYAKLCTITIKLARKRDYMFSKLNDKPTVNQFMSPDFQAHLYQVISRDIHIALKATKDAQVSPKSLRNFYHHIYSLLIVWLSLINYALTDI